MCTLSTKISFGRIQTMNYLTSKIQFGSQKLQLTPPPPPTPILLLKGLCRYYAGKKRETEKF